MFDLKSAERLLSGVERLLWAIDEFERLKPGSSSAALKPLIDQEALELSKAISEFAGQVTGEIRGPVETLSRATIWLRLDIEKNNLSLPPELVSLLRRGAANLKEVTAKHAAEEEARRDVQQAIRHGVLEEFVRRSPGRGAQKQIGPFCDKHYDHWSAEEGPVSWEEITIFVCSNDRWFLLEESFHREVTLRLDRTCREVTEAEAARVVLDRDEEVDVDTLVWAKRMATRSPDPAAEDIPRWDAGRGVLSFRGTMVREVSARAHQVRTLLTCFEECKWENPVDSPWPDDEEGKKSLNDAVRSLNKGCAGTCVVRNRGRPADSAIRA